MTEAIRKTAWTHWKAGHPMLAKLPLIPQVVGDAFSSYEWALAQQPQTPAGATRFGRLGEPPAGRFLSGVGWQRESDQAFMDALPPECQPAIRSSIVTLNWTLGLVNDMSKRGNWLFHGMTTALTIHAFKQQGVGLDHEVADSSKWDELLKAIALAVRDHGEPVIVRFGGEAASHWQGYHPGIFPRAFRKAVTIFRDAGADNAAFEYCMCDPAPADFAGPNWNPGADWFDWWGFDVFRPEHFSSLNARDLLDFAREERKPIILHEVSAQHVPIEQQTAGDFIDPLFQFIEGNADVVAALNYLSYPWHQMGSYAATWHNARLQDNPTLMARYIQEMHKPEWMHKGVLAP